MTSAHRGCRLKLHFAMNLLDGTEAENTFGGDPEEIVLGDGSFIQSLEDRLIGLSAGDRRTFDIPSTDGFGFRDPDLVHTIPLDAFPSGMNPEPGTLIGFTTPAGDETPGVVVDRDGEQVTVDFNHPLAGRDFTFTVEILSVECHD